MTTSKATPLKRKITLQLPSDLLSTLRELAATHQRSLNREVTWGLQGYVEASQPDSRPPAALMATRKQERNSGRRARDERGEATRASVP